MGKGDSPTMNINGDVHNENGRNIENRTVNNEDLNSHLLTLTQLAEECRVRHLTPTYADVARKSRCLTIFKKREFFVFV